MLTQALTSSSFASTTEFPVFDISGNSHVEDTTPVYILEKIPPSIGNYIWNKISPASKAHLIENDFVFPDNLNFAYGYYEVDDDKFVVDYETTLGVTPKGNIYFGQNLRTKEFLAFEALITKEDEDYTVIENIQTVVAQKNLKRCRGIIVDEFDSTIYMAKELINGIPLSKYIWERYSGDIGTSIKLALSYLEERKFIELSQVSQVYQNDQNTMIDLVKKKVILTDFSGPEIFNFKYSQFITNSLYPYINQNDLHVIQKLLPRLWQLEENGTISTDHKKIYSGFCYALEEIKKASNVNDSEPLYFLENSNNMFFKTTINELRDKLLNLQKLLGLEADVVS